MHKPVSELAFSGEWESLLPILRAKPDLVNHAKQPKGYTPLHQAAWHGASPGVIHELLMLGANPALTTCSKSQTPQEIAAEKHGKRPDLAFLLAVPRPSLSRVVRKVVSDNPDLFHDYDGNEFIYDRIVEALVFEPRYASTQDMEARFSLVVAALSGIGSSSARAFEFEFSQLFPMAADAEFWDQKLVPQVRQALTRQAAPPLERHWATMADLFEPAPTQWGLRGDLFLWIEMRQALSHLAIPEGNGAVASLLSNMYEAMVARSVHSDDHVFIPRLARGGMSSGMVDPEFWRRTFIPMMEQRAAWLNDAWRSVDLNKR